MTEKWVIRLVFAALLIVVLQLFIRVYEPQVGGAAGIQTISTDELGSWPCPLPGDLDCDCDVDIVDVMRVAALWGDRCE